MVKAADALVRCLEHEGVRHIFGVPGEETMDLLEALSSSGQIRFIPVRHEQGSAFMADVWGRLASELRERVLAAPTPREKLRVAEIMLLERAAGVFDSQPVVEYAVHNFLARPATLKIAEVTAKTGFSSRRFIELFKQHVGMPPKMFCRVRRFQSVLKKIASGQQVRWSDLALDCGYYDQAHFIHDFRSFSGINPVKYLNDHHGFPGHHNHLPII